MCDSATQLRVILYPNCVAIGFLLYFLSARRLPTLPQYHNSCGIDGKVLDKWKSLCDYTLIHSLWNCGKLFKFTHNSTDNNTNNNKEKEKRNNRIDDSSRCQIELF